MTRKEQVFALVNDEGVSAADVVAALGVSQSKARELLGELSHAGQIHRKRIGPNVSRYFLTAEAAERASEEANSASVLAAITESGWTVKRLREVVSIDRDTISKLVKELEAAGKVFSVTFRGATTYFPTEESARTFKVNQKPVAALPPTVQFRASVKSFVEGAQIIVPQGVKVQECPPFKGLGFRDEPAPVVGGFKTLGVGRYLPDEDAMLRRIARKGA